MKDIIVLQKCDGSWVKEIEYLRHTGNYKAVYITFLRNSLIVAHMVLDKCWSSFAHLGNISAPSVTNCDKNF